MLRYLIPTLLLASGLFFFIPRMHLPMAPALVYSYNYNLNVGAINQHAPDFLKIAGHPAFLGVEARQGESRILTGPGLRHQPVLEPGERVFVPFLGTGYFSYKKVGREIVFHSPDGEELWRKEFFSYPVSNARGETVLLLTGDNNRVDLISQDGASLGPGSLSGNFLSNYAFAANIDITLILFSDGRLVVLYKGYPICRYQLELDDAPLFAKSASIAPDGKQLAVHFLNGTHDEILVLDVDQELLQVDQFERIQQAFRDNAAGAIFEIPEADVVDRFSLPVIYPHILHMAVGAGGVLLVAPDKTYFFSIGAGDDWQKEYTKGGGVYRPVLAGQEFFIYGEGARLNFLDANGKLLHTKTLRSGQTIWRLLPTHDSASFAVHLKDMVEFWTLRHFDG